MKFSKIIKVLLVMAFVPTIAFSKDDFKNQWDSIAYSVGTNWGAMIKNDSLLFNIDALTLGIKDAMSGKTLKLTQEQIAANFQSLQKIINERQQRIQGEMAKKSKEEGSKFLAENAKKSNIKKTASGLQYEVLQKGKSGGKTPKETSRVKVHYLGTLLNGTKFDSSYDRNQPTEFELNRVIKGWTEGLQLMSEGAKYKFFIPSELAYGVNGMGQAIGPNQTLIFEVELLEVLSDPK